MFLYAGEQDRVAAGTSATDAGRKQSALHC